MWFRYYIFLFFVILNRTVAARNLVLQPDSRAFGGTQSLLIGHQQPGSGKIAKLAGVSQLQNWEPITGRTQGHA